MITDGKHIIIANFVVILWGVGWRQSAQSHENVNERKETTVLDVSISRYWFVAILLK